MINLIKMFRSVPSNFLFCKFLLKIISSQAGCRGRHPLQVKITLSLLVLTLTLTFFACDPNEGGAEYFSDVKEVSAGRAHTVAIKTDGTLWAWGRNNHGQLGDGTITDSYIPVQEKTKANNWVAVSAGWDHTVAIKNDRSLWAWGENVDGQLGLGHSGDGEHNEEPAKIGNDTNWVAVSAGREHTAAIKNDGSLWVWGLGYDNFPVRVGDANDWKSVSAGIEHTAAIKNDGSLWAWGENDCGQLGDGTTNYRIIPVQVKMDASKFFVDVKAVSAGRGYTTAIKNDGTLWTWGDNCNGQLGLGTYGYETNENNPVQVGKDRDWKTISAGESHTAVIKNDRSLWAWGMNEHGQLGNNSKKYSFSPVKIGESKWEAISAGSRTSDGETHTTAINSDGILYAWGNNKYGQLGDATTNSHKIPTRVIHSEGD